MRNATPAPIVVHPSRSATTTSAAASSSSLSKKRRLWFVACFILLVTSFGMIRWEFSPSTPSTPDHHNLHHHRRGTHPLRTQEGHVVAGKRDGEIAVANSDPPSHVLADVDDEDLVRWLPIDIDSGHHWHDFTPQLPQGATKFCPAFDDASMEVMEPYIPSGDPQEIPNRTVWVDGCREPVMLLPFQGIKMYPQLKCGALKPWRSYAFAAKVIRERFVAAAAAEEEEEEENRVAHGGGGDDSSNQKPAHADDTTTFVSDPIVISPEIGVTTEPPARVVQECLTKCLESPCCLTFTLERSSDFGGDADNTRRRSATFHAAATAFVCTLQLCDYTTAHHRREPVEMFKGYSYVIAHRREYRPSLVRSEWRLAVHRAPGRVLRLTEPLISSSSLSSAADYWKVHTNNDYIGHNDNNSSGVVLFEVRAVAEHGTRFQPVRGTVRFRVRCFGEIPVNRSVPTSPTRLSTDDDDVALEKYSSSFLDVASPEVTMFMGSATTDGRWLSPTAVWETCVGRVMRVDVDAIISRIILDEELRTPFPNGEEVLRLHTTLYSLVHRVANRVKLFIAPPRPAPASRFGERTLPPGLFSDSKDTCAPLLREGECCLRHLYASQSWNNHTCHFDYHNPTFLSALPARDKGCLIASSSHPMLERSYVTLAMDDEEEIPSGAGAVNNNNNNNTVVVATSVSERQQQQRPPCVRLVDGYTSHFDEDGVARFPNLVVWVNRRDARCVSDEISVRLNLMPRFEEDPFEGEFRRRQVGGATELLFLKKKKEKDTAAGEDRTGGGGRESSQVVPVSWFLASCGNRGTGKSAAAPPPPTDAADLSKYKKMEESKEDLQTPILISVPAHECVECLHSFLQNIRAFVWPSVVVIHFPSTIASLPAPSELAALNNSHPLTFINRLRVDSVIGVRLLHIHGLNVHYAMHELPWITFSHALFLASNEMFVKHGTIEYIRRHDAVWMTNPTADAGALYEHHGDGQHHWTVQEFLTMEEMLRYPPKKWGFVWPDAIVADHWLAAAMRRRNLTTHPFNTVLLEGTFFRRDIAGEFANEIMTMFDPFDYCEEPMLYPHCEILGPTVLQNVCSRPGVRCGHRVTTMLWLRDMWTSTVDDVRRVRCSPFEIPFGFKRVPRTMTDPVRIAITRLTHEALLTNDTKTASEPSSIREVGDYCIIPSHEE